ncbi:unnamed protein product [Prorocentrum cordatum]|uniref:Uncharacterized protein n=1 Tax=Prorocentrum cordatum TaxID=2364126 RepID=A0ABN9PKJ0_9DINO|nr:unnamed protein product [Polarella glacialis]
MEGLTDEEADAFAGLVLGGASPGPGASSLEVPAQLRRFLRDVALNIPRHIEEALQQLRREEAIRVSGQRVEVLKNLEDPQVVNVAGWMHTSMVGSIVSQVEMMGPEAQRVIKMATVFESPFSAFDVAVANRVHRPSSDVLAFQDAVQLLLSCEWLANHPKFLVRHHGVIEDQQTENMPRWKIANQLVRRVVGASLLRSQRIQVKRIVLMARAVNLHLPRRMREKWTWSQREELYGKPSKAERLRQQRRREAEPAALGRELAGLQAPDFLREVEFVAAASSASWGQASCGAPEAAEGGGGLAAWLFLMCHAAQRDHVAELLRQGAPPLARDRSGRTPLHWSCARGDLDVVQALVEAAADPLAEAAVLGGGETPLELAALQGHLGVVRYLVEEREVLDRLPDRLRSPSHWSRLLLQAQASSPPTPMPSDGSPQSVAPQKPNSNQKHALSYLQDAVIWTRDLDDADRGGASDVGARPRAGEERRQARAALQAAAPALAAGPAPGRGGAGRAEQAPAGVERGELLRSEQPPPATLGADEHGRLDIAAERDRVRGGPARPRGRRQVRPGIVQRLPAGESLPQLVTRSRRAPYGLAHDVGQPRSQFSDWYRPVLLARVCH